ncbi:MAG: hypothetical protein IJF73_06985 [Clostridia bacterium]|nr:hypothetical protein [Clostridia bacterium]
MQRLLIEMRRYRRGLLDLFVIALFGAVNLILTLADSSFTLILSPFSTTFVFSFFEVLSRRLGRTVLLTLGIFLGLCLSALWFFLWYYASRRRRSLLLATVLYGSDTLLLLGFSLRYHYGVGLADTLLHLCFLYTLIRATVAHGRLDKSAAPAMAEVEGMLATLMEDPLAPALGDTVGDAPADATDTPPLREVSRRGRPLILAEWEGHTLLVTRSYGLTELIVDGKVYAEERGVYELAYTLTATVGGHRITVRFYPGNLRATMTLLVDGVLVSRIRRRF